jgi:hypothetical protein
MQLASLVTEPISVDINQSDNHSDASGKARKCLDNKNSQTDKMALRYSSASTAGS